MNKVIWEDMEMIESTGLAPAEAFRDKTVLITGAYGMLASYLVFYLIYLNEKYGTGVEIVCLGRSEEKMRARFGDYAEREWFHFLKGDVTEEIAWEGSVDYVIHAASHASPQVYAVDPVGVMMPNLMGTYRTLSLARERGAEGYLFFSTGEVYGAAPCPVVGEHDFGPYDPTNLRSCYGESKRAGETMCVSFAHQFGLHAMIVRPSHTFGPTMDTEHDGRVFASFMGDAIAGRDIVMKSDGSAVRSFIYIADAAAAYLSVLLHGQAGEAYNVSNPDGRRTIRQIAECAAALSPGGRSQVICLGEDKSVPSRGKNVYDRMDVSKLEALNWRARVGVEEGFARCMRALSDEG